MKEEEFIKSKSAIWRDLEALSTIVNKKGIKSLHSSEIKRFLYLFRQSSHHLAYARVHYPQSSTTGYLNSLIAKSHNQVYAIRKISPDILVKYFTYEFPKLLMEFKWYIMSSFILFFMGVIISLLLVLINPENAPIFLPQNLVEGIKAGATSKEQWNHPLMSSYIMINNITVSLNAFVLGITLGIGTIYVLFINGVMLGALTALIYLYGSPLNYWSLILPHGVIELAAIFISGGAGLIIAKHMLIPGLYSRKDSIINGAKKAVSLVAGIAVMLVIAGIIEGFFTPRDISEYVKLTFAAITAIILVLYFSIPYYTKK